MKTPVTGFISCALAAAMLGATGCATPEEGAAVGAVTGAAIGILAMGALGGPHGGPGPGYGHHPHHGGGPDPFGAALLGAGVGAVVGASVGQQNQQQERLNAKLDAVQQSATQTTVWVTNSNNSRTPVLLRQGNGGIWIGPKGETYMSMPSEEQLKSVYGF